METRSNLNQTPGRDAAEQVKELKRIAKLRQRNATRRGRTQSVLDKYRGELIALKEAGASFADLEIWLDTIKKIAVDRTTIFYRFKRWEKGYV